MSSKMTYSCKVSCSKIPPSTTGHIRGILTSWCYEMCMSKKPRACSGNPASHSGPGSYFRTAQDCMSDTSQSSFPIFKLYIVALISCLMSDSWFISNDSGWHQSIHTEYDWNTLISSCLELQPVRLAAQFTLTILHPSGRYPGPSQIDFKK